ncbi:hypothetical protein O6H91_Y418100 [Diphasiastrum complanatum]|nr:hypothetical protein O6H91_Y418100 [Diphasiastrum complanatum]
MARIAGEAASEYVVQKQRYFHSVHRLTHLKGPFDKVASVYVPLTLVALTSAMLVRF